MRRRLNRELSHSLQRQQIAIAADDHVSLACNCTRDHTIVETRVHPSNPDLSWSWLRIADPSVGSAIGRKVPHYGKYSYLIFDGTTNVGKGTWTIASTPMSAVLH